MNMLLCSENIYRFKRKRLQLQSRKIQYWSVSDVMKYDHISFPGHVYGIKWYAILKRCYWRRPRSINKQSSRFSTLFYSASHYFTKSANIAAMYFRCVQISTTIFLRRLKAANIQKVQRDPPQFSRGLFQKLMDKQYGNVLLCLAFLFTGGCFTNLILSLSSHLLDYWD